MHVVVAEHGQGRVRRAGSPWKERAVVPAGGLFPFGLGRQPLPFGFAVGLGFRPTDVHRRPGGQAGRGHAMDAGDVCEHGDKVVRGGAIGGFQEGQVVSHGHFVAIDAIGVEPDAPLGLFGVVVGRRHAERIIVFPQRAHEKPAGGDFDHRLRPRGFCNARDDVGTDRRRRMVVRRLRRGRRRKPSDDEPAEYGGGHGETASAVGSAGREHAASLHVRPRCLQGAMWVG